MIVAAGMTANTKHDAYAVWLFNSGGSARSSASSIPASARTAALQTERRAADQRAQFKQMLVTLETQAKPKTPGTIVLQGALQTGQPRAA